MSNSRHGSSSSPNWAGQPRAKLVSFGPRRGARQHVQLVGPGRDAVVPVATLRSRSHEPPKYVRKSTGSIVDAVEPQIRALLAEFPEMPTSVIMERVGWQRGKTVFFERVHQLRPLFTPADPASRTEYQPGELAQSDLWFPPVDVPLGFGWARRHRRPCSLR